MFCTVSKCVTISIFSEIWWHAQWSYIVAYSSSVVTAKMNGFPAHQRSSPATCESARHPIKELCLACWDLRLLAVHSATPYIIELTRSIETLPSIATTKTTMLRNQTKTRIASVVAMLPLITSFMKRGSDRQWSCAKPRVYSVSLKKGNRDSILNLSKSKRKIIQFLSVDDIIVILHSRSYWVRDGCSAILFVMHVKTVFVKVRFALLLCCESSANSANLDKTILICFHKIDCCAAIRGRIWMNNISNESRIIMLSCTEISFVISFFDFGKFWVNPDFPF